MKRTKRFFLSLLLALISFCAHAHDFKVDGIYFNILSKTDLTCEVTYEGSSYSNPDYINKVVIPSHVTHNDVTYSVTSIGWNAFENCSGLTSVTIPNSVTSIGGYAFNGCI